MNFTFVNAKADAVSRAPGCQVVEMGLKDKIVQVLNK